MIPFHVGLTVTDLDSAVKFFSELFGLELTQRRTLEGNYLSTMLELAPGTAAEIAFLRLSDRYSLELVQYSKPEDTSDALTPVHSKGTIASPNTPHFAFFVPDLEGFLGRAESWNLVPLGRCDQVVPAGPYAGSRICFFRSEFGCFIEIIEQRSP